MVLSIQRSSTCSMLKKFVSVAIFISWAFFTAVLIEGLVFYQNNKSPNNPNSTKISPAVSNGSPITLNTQEIVKHNSSSDCWLIINQKVYNVTTYLYQHPGNAGTILPSCGKEATNAFNTKGRSAGNTHSGFANSLLNDFLLGSVGQTISGQTVNIPSVNIPLGRGRDD